ncbi:hypothetical protein ACFOLJ_01860 [Rugamonas sp. CCM 8940]|uniref:hypothetical protein n=1 Tax=Rugamonas sp. CCM 8940 TaxID=2765359 RepID=UPI0018F35C0C|nr:hypothetical protein [Rugamonas sp. CCM 8940]MBJ7311688.1 hypothetical protein [Rugamonas sp. CCM 8940]
MNPTIWRAAAKGAPNLSDGAARRWPGALPAGRLAKLPMLPMLPMLALWAGAVAPLAQAASEAEEAMRKAPMPHQIYQRGGVPVAVHRARLDGQQNSPGGEAAALAGLRQLVQQCVASHPGAGASLHPPTQWPEHVLALREDHYMAANRSITYFNSVAHAVRPDDCALLARPVSRAVLVSSKGSCQIDLLRKTARGVCDAGGHADAAGEPRGAAAALSGAAAGLGGVRTGQFKNVAGVRCEIWRQSAFEATLCFADGGAFAPARAAGNAGWAGLLLETDSQMGRKMSAVEAKLDSEVNSAVFTPYNGDGFSISAKGAAK